MGMKPCSVTGYAVIRLNPWENKEWIDAQTISGTEQMTSVLAGVEDKRHTFRNSKPHPVCRIAKVIITEETE